jgi:hydrogenase nickel incorporation protein HypA/HybF
VKTIDVEVGELTAVVPELFKKFFPVVAENFPSVRDAEINLKVVPGEAMCRDCHALYNIVKNEGECPVCHSSFKKILGGQQITLLNIGY